MRHALLALALAPALCATAAAQADIIHYTFDNGDATNSAIPGVGNGFVDTGVAFGSGGLCTGAGDTAAISGLAGDTCVIDTGWTVDLGTSDWTVGMWVDQRPAGNGFQYFFGTFSGSQFRCFGGTGGSMFLSMAGGGFQIVGGASATATTHLVWTYDAAALEVRGYLDGVLNSVYATQVLDLQDVEPLTVMKNRDSANSMLAGNIMDDFRIYRRCLDQAEIDAWFGCAGGAGIGTGYCSPSVPNSTGQSGLIEASGSETAADNNVTLTASQLPQNQFGYFLNSQSQGFIVGPGGSQGNLCLALPIGRYSNSIFDSGTTGSASLALDLTSTPTPSGNVAVLAGETWNFTAWYRDVNPGATSNFTDAVSIDFN